MSFLSRLCTNLLLYSPELALSVFSTIESCIRDVFSWMTSNKLSVNPNKTEYFLLNPNKVNVPVNIINLSSNTISPRDSAKNFGLIFHTDMSMYKHISSIVKFCFLQLRDFCRIRPFIPKPAAITLANAFIHSRLGFVTAFFMAFLNILFIAYTKYSCSHRYRFSFFAHNCNSQIFTLASYILMYYFQNMLY